jgi:hypothetical protein
MSMTDGRQLTQQALSATLHCLTGCAIGEVLGMVLATWWGWADAPSIALAVVLAFVFGYALSLRPVLRAGVTLTAALGVVFAADTLSITIMEIIDNAVILAWPGAMDAGLGDALFWGSLALGLGIAFVVTVPVNRWLIARGKGHAVAHQYHHGQPGPEAPGPGGSGPGGPGPGGSGPGGSGPGGPGPGGSGPGGPGPGAPRHADHGHSDHS